MEEQRIIELRKILHQNPEPSMNETTTKEILMHFISSNTSWNVVDRGAWFFAEKKGISKSSPIAFRADFDAVVCADGTAKHLCGHDGHSAVLAGLASSIDETQRDVYLIFQPGEETGQGGSLCSELIEEKQIEEIYGFHNIPGYETNEVLILEKTFACASAGLRIDLIGKIAHAAYPEQGINPAGTIADILSFVDAYVKRDHRGIVLGTLIGIDAGSHSYGVSADHAQIRFTLRAEYQDEFEHMIRKIEEYVRSSADLNGLECRITRIEEFPATINHLECVQRLKKEVSDLKLGMQVPKEPFRWSEDFGYYLQKTKGAFFGIGCGIDHPGLHTVDYEFNDQIIPTAISILKSLC